MNSLQDRFLLASAIVIVIGALAAYFLAGCAAPRISNRFVSYHDNGTTATMIETVESGPQLLIYNRHYLQTPESSAADISDSNMTIIACTALGALGGSSVGQPVLGAVAGGGAGLIVKALSKDKPTTNTAVNSALRISLNKGNRP